MVSYRTVVKTLSLALMAFTLLVVSCSTNEAGIVTEQERLAQSIDRSIMCPVCPSETIDESQVPIAKQMRGLVREKLEEGLTKEQILAYFAERYGNGILAKPPMNGFNLLVWIVPPVFVLGGIFLMVVIINYMRKPMPELNLEIPEVAANLEAYLKIVDRNIDILKENIMPNEETN